MRTDKTDAAREGAELSRLKCSASALVAALLLLLEMLMSPLLGRTGLSAAAKLSSPDPLGLSKRTARSEEAPQITQLPQYDGGVSVRVFEAEEDVSPEIEARLLTITAEVMNGAVFTELTGDGPKILIYHTHDTEAYTQTERFSYEPSGDWRTEDMTRSVIAVGEELARILGEQYGIETIHDTTPHEKPLITTAYARSLETMLRYKEEYPTLEMFIDLHRDGVGATGYENDCVTVNGVKTARLMFVVGTGQGASGTEDDPLPDFESNYALAAALTQSLESACPGITRKVRVKTGKYNQQVSNKCVLVEVGHNANTLEQALAAMPLLAAAIAEVSGIVPSSAPISFSP